MDETIRFVFVSIIITFAVGNLFASLLGAYPRKFRIIPYDKEEQKKLDMLKNTIQDDPDDISLHLQLGEIYTMHNDITLARRHLDKCLTASGNQNGRALAWWASNHLKYIRGRIDLTWGIWKLWQVSKTAVLLDEAIRTNPDDFVIRLIRISSLVGLQGRRQFDVIFEDEKFFLERITAKVIPEEITNLFYTAMSEAYLIKSKKDRKNKKTHLKRSRQYQ